MRKTSYAIAFLGVSITLILNVLSLTRADWLISKHSTVLGATYDYYYGLNQLCELKTFSVGSEPWTSYSCRQFPLREEGDCSPPPNPPWEEPSANKTTNFCETWTSASYAAELGVGLSAIALMSILVGVSTQSRRRRIWRAVAVLVGLQAIFQIMAFSIVTHLYQNSALRTFETARPGAGYILNTVSWVTGCILTISILITGMAADRNHRWAAGNRAYSPIGD
ncbi:hypothetical protein C8J56DRAFT_926107 [Mycena floridula]|nr:hypothetical protein C8J56DRAFT_926107 [Mycena floridula]